MDIPGHISSQGRSTYLSACDFLLMGLYERAVFGTRSVDLTRSGTKGFWRKKCLITCQVLFVLCANLTNAALHNTDKTFHLYLSRKQNRISSYQNKVTVKSPIQIPRIIQNISP